MESWLQNLSSDTAIIVPTRSLANTLSERIAQDHLISDIAVWESPNILLWSDYLKLLWQLNQNQIADYNQAHSLITTQQSLLLWTQVIEKSRRKEQELTLLNVQQTAKAVQRSWRLMHDWQVSLDAVAQDHVADTQKLLEWLNAYQELLTKRGFMDEPMLAKSLLAITHEQPFKNLVWYSYDLITVSQRAFVQLAEDSGVNVDYRTSEEQTEQRFEYRCFSNTQDELTSGFISARERLEAQPNLLINIVIPDLQHRQAQVREIAREVFYPSLSPLQLQQQSSVYRFSLGEPLQQWPAVEVALLLIKFLRNGIKRSEFSFILRNRFLRSCLVHKQEYQLFDRWLRQRRISNIKIDQLSEFYQQCLLKHPLDHDSTLLPFLESLNESFIQLKEKLVSAKSESGFAAFSFSDWADIIDTWLNTWGWNTSIAGEEMSSVQFQLRERWLSLLKEYASLDAVQGQVGLSRALEVFQQMTHDGIFQPQAAASPILISGVYEAIGQSADVCYLLGMDQNYPVPAQNDAFIANRLLLESGYPDASALQSFEQAKQVIKTLLVSVTEVNVSYALENQQNREIKNSVSAIFREDDFIQQPLITTSQDRADLDHYTDQHGPSLSSGKNVRGGARIFTNQSNCAFKAFVTHQLEFDREDESEFGLDSLDRGNIVHRLLESAWTELQTQQRLLELTDHEFETLIKTNVAAVIESYEAELSYEKFELLKLETNRLSNLLTAWLVIDAQRPTPFTVIEQEEVRLGELGGIHFKYIIDRLDILDDGRSVIVDYKTGAVAKKDWQGERLKDPQLPLYALTLNKEKRKDVSGIAFAKVKQNDSKYDFLSEAGIFKTGKSNDEKNEQAWLENSKSWPDIFAKLADDFLQGQASVNPIDQKVCGYCELKPVCRVSQLTADAGQIFITSDESGESQ